MGRSDILYELDIARAEAKTAKGYYESSRFVRGFTYAALTTATLCAAYGVAKLLFDFDISDSAPIFSGKVIGYSGVVLGVVGTLGLIRKAEEKRMVVNSKRNLDSLMIELAKVEYKENMKFEDKNRDNKRREK